MNESNNQKPNEDQDNLSLGDTITAKNDLNSNPKLYACKVIERAKLNFSKNNLVASEIQN